uniref:NADH-ubiquinone oxidoreductase chain 5 n=1 Tax=Climacia areolaris TaxID=560896 RepID=A0A1S5QYP9_9NEOP|nr:NADH dehydrogenase subunit 5 [Climacia areolaris]
MYKKICFLSFIILLLLSMLNFFSSLYFIINDKLIFIEWELLSLNSTMIVMTILLDWMSLMFMSFVLFISSMVIYYSNEYMSGDYNLYRFIMLVLMFVLSMMFLIISPNLISILLGWDGLGLVSYLLVIYYQNVKSYNAGMLTALSNRIGDVTLLMAIAWMLNYGSWNYIYYLDCMKSNWEMQVIILMVVIAAMTKSAQIPFSSWLPAAMAAPTPVSALVHSSTLVTAGVYLLIRFNELLMASFLSKFLLLFSGLTMFMAGLGANFEYDLKKIIALSTLSQLGLMMSILSMGYMKLAFFHLLTHALFKALLFMCAGSIIHNMKNYQDIRYMGMLMMNMPLTTTFLNIANMALCGMPFLAGFYSKDLILEISSMSYINMFSYLLFYLSTGLTVSYSIRLVYYSLLNNLNSSSLMNLNDSGYIMLKGMISLVILTLMGGSMLNWLIISPSMIYLPMVLKLMVYLVIILGAWMGLEIYNISMLMKSYYLKFYNMNLFMGNMWYMPLLSVMGLNQYILKIGWNYIKYLDQGWSEYLGGQGIYNFMKSKSMYYQLFMNNEFKIYFLLFIILIILLFIFM